MANDRVYLFCGDCHPPGLSAFEVKSSERPACIIKVWGIEPRPLDCGPNLNAQAELARFCEAHEGCGHRGFYLADELGRPLPGLVIPAGENRWHPPPYREEP